VRACYKGGWGFASFNDLAELAAQVEDAVSAARMVGQDETLLAPVDPVQVVQRLPLTGTDPRHISLARKKDLCRHYADLLQSIDDRIATTSVH
jgi:TldD protein